MTRAARGRVTRRKKRSVVSSTVVAAATVGVTGVTMAWAVSSTPSSGSAAGAAAQVTGQIAADQAALTRLRQSIADTRDQLTGLGAGGSASTVSAGGPSAPGIPGTPTAATVPRRDRCRGRRGRERYRVRGWDRSRDGNRRQRHRVGRRVTRRGDGVPRRRWCRSLVQWHIRWWWRPVRRHRHGVGSGAHRTAGHGAAGDGAAGDDSPAGDGHHPRLVGVSPTRTADATTVLGTVRAMAGEIVVYGRTPGDGAAPDPAVARALGVFRSVHDACTRFDRRSPLMRANARPGEWHTVPQVLFDAVEAAHAAYEETGGAFDPRVLGDLVRLGYDRSLPFADGVAVPAAPRPTTRPTTPWRPRLRPGRTPGVHLGGAPIDLGGIGKGLAVRWASQVLRGALDDFLVDAGGDCDCEGTGPEADGWRVGVEDPGGGELPLAVLALRDRACTTSSTRLRRWRAGGRPVHHLIDPTTGLPGGEGLVAVTVVATDAADAEVAAKSLFLVGARSVADEARVRGAAALWVTDEGAVATSRAMDPFVVWRAP